MDGNFISVAEHKKDKKGKK